MSLTCSLTLSFFLSIFDSPLFNVVSLSGMSQSMNSFELFALKGDLYHFSTP